MRPGVLDLPATSKPGAHTVERVFACIVATWRRCSLELARCSKKLSSTAQLVMQQHRWGDQALLIEAVEHDGMSLSNIMIVTVEDFGLAVAFNVENEDEQLQQALLLLFARRRTTVPAASMDVRGLVGSVFSAPSRCDAA